MGMGDDMMTMSQIGIPGSNKAMTHSQSGTGLKNRLYNAFGIQPM